jgi:hypothetical protein
MFGRKAKSELQTRRSSDSTEAGRDVVESEVRDAEAQTISHLINRF